MKKAISILIAICLLVVLTSCKSVSDWQKAEHTYSQLGFTVSYNYPNGCNVVSSDDDPNMCIYVDGIEDKLDWSISMSVSDMNFSNFEFKTSKDLLENEHLISEHLANSNNKVVVFIFFFFNK